VRLAASVSNPQIHATVSRIGCVWSGDHGPMPAVLSRVSRLIWALRPAAEGFWASPRNEPIPQHWASLRIQEAFRFAARDD
jgi:hypothetical protein